MSSSGYQAATKCIHSGNFNDEAMGGLTHPVFNSTANSPSTGTLYYPRYMNIPTQVAVAQKIAALENAEDGLVFSSGMAAITAALFGLLIPGDHVVFAPDLYGGTHFLITSEFERSVLEYSFSKSNDFKDFEREIKPNTKLIYIETPSNPLLKITDIAAISDLARKHNILTAIDNTFATPINQKPLKLGMDIVIHSGTKYLNGHSDLLCGALLASKELVAKIRPYAVNHGAILNGQSCFLLDRGLKTLAIRVKQQNENALQLARFLSSQKLVKKVFYPGLESHEDHKIAARQMKGFGGMLSFELNCNREQSLQIVSKLNLVKEAGSLGGVESSLCFPSTTSHAKVTPEEREKMGISDSLIRLSVGIEDIQDLIQDFDQALNK